MNYLIPIFFGITPSIIWLLFYLRKDVHPESNRMVLKIFFYGVLITLPVFLAELGVSEFLKEKLAGFGLQNLLVMFLYWFFAVALVEEIFKYLVVKYKILNHPEFDEPIDVMLYMIIAALGFAALENILALLSTERTLVQAVTISSLRFIGATFLHALCSGTIGYFLALSFFETKKRSRLIISGLVIAIALHALFNVSIIGIENSSDSYSLVFFISLAITILGGLALFVSYGIKRVKKLSSVCKTT